MTLLLLKVVLAPALVVATSRAGRRWGPPLAGVLVTLPIVAGPILVILAVEQSATFAGQAAAASLLGIVALGAFGLTFAASCWRSRRSKASRRYSAAASGTTVRRSRTGCGGDLRAHRVRGFLLRAGRPAPPAVAGGRLRPGHRGGCRGPAAGRVLSGRRGPGPTGPREAR